MSVFAEKLDELRGTKTYELSGFLTRRHYEKRLNEELNAFVNDKNIKVEVDPKRTRITANTEMPRMYHFEDLFKDADKRGYLVCAGRDKFDIYKGRPLYVKVRSLRNDKSDKSKQPNQAVELSYSAECLKDKFLKKTINDLAAKFGMPTEAKMKEFGIGKVF